MRKGKGGRGRKRTIRIGKEDEPLEDLPIPSDLGFTMTPSPGHMLMSAAELVDNMHHIPKYSILLVVTLLSNAILE